MQKAKFSTDYHFNIVTNIQFQTTMELDLYVLSLLNRAYGDISPALYSIWSLSQSELLSVTIVANVI